MKSLNKIIAMSLLASSTLLANKISIDTIGINLGKINSSYSKKDNSGSIALGNTPDESFSSIEVFTTLNPVSEICKKYNMKPYLSYTYSHNADLKHNYLLAGANKYYEHNKISLYSGLLLGYGQMDWRYDPLNSSKSKNEDANSFIAGIQAGALYPVSNKLSLGLNGKYLIHDYETKLNPSSGISSKIEQKRTYGVSLSLAYKF